MSQVTVRKIDRKNKDDFKTYFNFPWKLYKDNPYWTPPLKSMRKHELDQDKGALWEYTEGDHFIAEKDGEAVGIVTAFVNHRHNDTWNENIAWFGDIEFIEDQAVVSALLEAAENWAKERGYDALRGPVRFNLHGEPGIRIGAHDEISVLLYPYHPEYYAPMIEAAGYAKEKDLLNWRSSNDNLIDEDNPLYVKMKRITEKNNKRRNIVVRPGNPKDKDKDFELIRELYNTAWKDNWGFVPLTDRELDEMIADMKDFYQPDMTFFAFVDGKQAGFMLAIPDLNQALNAAYPNPKEPELLTLLKVLWHWRVRPKITRVRAPLLGVKEEYRGMGLDGSLFLKAIERAKEMDWESFDGGWTLEDNEGINAICRKLQTDMYVKFRIYQKSLN